MQVMRVLVLLLFFLAGQAHAAQEAALKTGVQTFAGTLPKIAENDSSLDWNFDLSQEKFYIAVPRNYMRQQPFGLLVFISPSDECTALPPGWASVLSETKLIFVAPQKCGNEHPVSRRAGLAVLAATKMLEMARIDRERIYVAGFSGGARVASRAPFLRPTLFSGAFAISGADFPRRLPRVRATEKDEYGYFSLTEKQMNDTKQRAKFVLVTGPKDFRHGNILDIYEGGYQKDGYSVKLIDVPGMGHAICSSKPLRDGVAFLDKKMEAAPNDK